MKDQTTLPPLNPRDFLSACQELVGDTYLIKLFNIGIRYLQRLIAKRPYVDEDSVRENYLEKHEQLLKRLGTEPGGLEVARAIVARHAHIVGCELRCLDAAEPDKKNMEAECLDDYPPITQLHEAIRAGKPKDEVRHLWQQSKRELDETYEMYCKENLDKKDN